MKTRIWNLWKLISARFHRCLSPAQAGRGAARDLLFQPRRSVTAHRPGLEGVQGEEGVKEPHFAKFDRRRLLRSNIWEELPRVGRRSALDLAPREHTPAGPARFRPEIRRVVCPVRVLPWFNPPDRRATRRRETGLQHRERGPAHREGEVGRLCRLRRPLRSGFADFARCRAMAVPFEIIAPPPVLGWRLDLVTPPPLRRHVERLHRLDVEGRPRRRRQRDDSLP